MRLIKLWLFRQGLALLRRLGVSEQEIFDRVLKPLVDINSKVRISGDLTVHHPDGSVN